MSNIMKGMLNEGEVVQGPWGNESNYVKLANEFMNGEFAPQDTETATPEDVMTNIWLFLVNKHRNIITGMPPLEILDLAKEIANQVFKKYNINDNDLNENLHQWFKEKWVRFGPDGKIRGACARGDDSEGKPKCLPQKKAHSLGKKGRKYAAAKKRREDPNPERRGKAKNVATKKKTNEDAMPNFMKAGNMKPFTKSGEEIPGSVKTLEKLLLKAKERGIELNYHNIDQMMQSVAKKHHLTGDELHNEFVSKHHMIPDDWIVKQLDENCWKGYHKEGNKKMFGKTYPNCVKNEDQAPMFTPEEKCPHCGGELVSEELINEKQDACYRKVKARYKVWPSAYASGALVQCRKKGAANWGNGGKKNESSIMKGIVDEAGSPAQQAAIAINMKKQGKKPKNESAYEKDLQDNEPRTVIGVYGAKSKEFRKKFSNQKAQDRFFDHPDREGNYEIHYVQKLDELLTKTVNAARRGIEKKVGLDPAMDSKKKEKHLSSFKTGTNKVLGLAKVNATNESVVNEAQQKFSQFYPSMDDPNFNPEDPAINIIGVGVYNLSRLKKKALSECEALYVELRNEQYEAAAYHADQFYRTMKSLGESLAELERYNEAGATVSKFFKKPKLDEMPDTSGPVGTQEGGWRTYKPKSAGIVKKESSILKGIRR